MGVCGRTSNVSNIEKMLTNQEAKYLLNLEKVLTNPNQTIDLSKKKNRLELISHQDSDHEFWVEITTNQKIILKTSIHHLESNSYVVFHTKKSPAAQIAHLFFSDTQPNAKKQKSNFYPTPTLR